MNRSGSCENLSSTAWSHGHTQTNKPMHYVGRTNVKQKS